MAHHRSATTAHSRHPVARVCLLGALLTAVIVVVYWPSTVLVVLVATVSAGFLLGAAARSLRRASRRIDGILAEGPNASDDEDRDTSGGPRHSWPKSA